MAKRADQKKKLLLVRELLLTRTDEEHPLTALEIVDILGSEYNLPTERKSIYDDIRTLTEAGLDIIAKKGANPGYFVGSRTFQLPELKLLMDAVQASRFITRKKSAELLKKLEGLASVHQAKQLQRQVFVSGRVKTMNESIYYYVDKLHTALSSGSSISVHYFDYDIHHQRSLHHEGQLYAATPFGLIWNDSNYYLVAFDHKNQDLRHYRVDKMCDIKLTPQVPAQGRDLYPDFRLDDYGRRHFGMYTGHDQAVTLRGLRSKAGLVWDRFGQDIIMVPDGEDCFTVTITVALSPQFYGWLCGLNNAVVLAGPQSAVDGYHRYLKKALEADRPAI